MRITIYQPRYFPQLHYFNRILSSDVFVILDGAQYTKSLVHHEDSGKSRRHTSYQSDTPIKLSQGMYLLTIPVRHDGLLPLRATTIDYMHKWVPKHLATIKTAYGRSPYFSPLFSSLRALLTQKEEILGTFTTKTIIWGLSHVLELNLSAQELTLEHLNAKLQKTKSRLKNVISDSDTGVSRPEGLQKGTEWTVAICRMLGATEYYHGGTARAGYMELDQYKKFGITPLVQEWKCQSYTQQFQTIPFIPNLSIIDLIMNVSPKKAREILGVNG